MNIIRTDIHRPSAIKPHEYKFVAHDYFGPAGNDRLLMNERLRFAAHRKATGGKISDHEHGGSCHVCGAAALYVARFYRAATNTYITTGEDCALKMAMGDANAFRKFRKAMGKAREFETGKRRAEKILTDAGLAKAWELYNAEYEALKVNGAVPYEESTIRDIVGKLVKYGSVTDKAMNYVRVLLDKIPARARIAAERAAEAEAAAPVPVTDKRIDIVGEVLTVKEHVSAFGPTMKMLVKTDAGYKLWGTRPAAIYNTERGDRVKFTAAVTRSDRDEKFGFFNRPTNAEILKEAA